MRRIIVVAKLENIVKQIINTKWNQRTSTVFADKSSLAGSAVFFDHFDIHYTPLITLDFDGNNEEEREINR